MSLDYPAPSSVWETNHSSKPTLPVKHHQISLFTRRKSFEEQVANGGAGTGTDAHIWMSMAKISLPKPAKFLC